MAFNAQAATARYIDSLGTANLEKAAAYTIGNHWHLLWGLIVSAVITWLVVRWGVLDRLQARLERRGFAMRAFLVSATQKNIIEPFHDVCLGHHLDEMIVGAVISLEHWK